MARQRAGIDAAQPRKAVATQLILEGSLTARMADVGGELPHHQRTALDPIRLGGIVTAAVVADERIGHHHHLSRVGRIGDHLLVAAHAGVEDHLAVLRTLQRRAEEGALVRRTGFEGEAPAHIRHW